MYFSASIAAAILAFAPSTLATTYQVSVGANNLQAFNPNQLNVQQGDSVAFNFVAAVRATSIAPISDLTR